MEKPRPPAELTALWRIEGHLKNISHCAMFIVFALCLWMLVTLGGIAMQVASEVSRPPTARAPSNP